MGMIVPVMGTKSGVTPAELALFGRTRAAVLALLFGRPDRELYLSEIVRSVDAGTGAVQRELALLTAMGLLKRTARGKQVYFHANADSPLYPELRGLVVKTFGVVGVLRDALTPLGKKVRLAAIYGSFARGTEAAPSDVDLLVIGTAQLFEVVSALSPAQDTLRREVNPVVFPLPEARRKLKAKDRFLTDVLSGAKLLVIGGERELAELAS
jgi:predicted nucleotidyltransferase